MIDQELLDELWDFDDAAATEARLHIELQQGGPYDEIERSELKTQLARAIGLQERYDDAAEMLIGVEAAEAPVVIARVLLESGRILNSAGKGTDAAPLFLRAAEIAGQNGLIFLQVDALHMLAIATPSNAEHWIAQAVAIAAGSPDERTRRWLISLHNTLGWSHFDAGEFEAAMSEFVTAARWADLVGTEQQRTWAAEAIAECEIATQSDEL